LLSKTNLYIFKKFLCGYALFPLGAALLAFSIFLFVQFFFHKTSLWLLNISLIIFVLAILTNIYTYIIGNKNNKNRNFTENLLKIDAIVIRDGKKMALNHEELVVGDLVEIKCGEYIPADIRVIKSDGLKVDNSIFTGETMPKTRTSEFTNDNELETSNLVFYKTKAIEGTATGIVIRTGNNTFANRLGVLISSRAIHRPIIEYLIIISLSIFGVIGIIGIITANIFLI
jgi:P-type E1-E2 ATPase